MVLFEEKIRCCTLDEVLQLVEWDSRLAIGMWVHARGSVEVCRQLSGRKLRGVDLSEACVRP